MPAYLRKTRRKCPAPHTLEGLVLLTAFLSRSLTAVGESKGALLELNGRWVVPPDAKKSHHPSVLRGVCVTGSVTIGSERDEQDASGHDPPMEAYLA
jgi:hypothetical protein